MGFQDTQMEKILKSFEIIWQFYYSTFFFLVVNFTEVFYNESSEYSKSVCYYLKYIN